MILFHSNTYGTGYNTYKHNILLCYLLQLEDLPDDDKEKSLGLLHQLNLSNEHYLVGLTSLQPQTSPQEIDPVKNVVSYLPSGKL